MTPDEPETADQTHFVASQVELAACSHGFQGAAPLGRSAAGAATAAVFQGRIHGSERTEGPQLGLGYGCVHPADGSARHARCVCPGSSQ